MVLVSSSSALVQSALLEPDFSVKDKILRQVERLNKRRQQKAASQYERRAALVERYLARYGRMPQMPL